ncbi:hypothetical protein ALQ95_03948 [Pseudomonas syringae pv. ribicola]|uniref:Uncharacterized protein n=2 Tax=Pseudomonas TaxID=286 RepID=A0A3M2W2Y7_PSESI|nr:hypothetical protein ALQ95_03948 [Pseudomonas syringae pv. ribicola]
MIDEEGAAPKMATCNGCGKSITKAKKVHKQLKYCETCYPRLFKRSMCACCGNFARLPVFDPTSPCQRCVSAEPCVRCKRTGRPVGKLTLYGPACNSCAHYYSTPEPCEICQTLSTRLSRTMVDGEPRNGCPRCVRASQGSCQACRRHRVLIKALDGRKLCKACNTLKSVLCTRCGEAMPAGLGKECLNCFWQKTFQRRLTMNTEAFNTNWMRRLFIQFGEWLPSQVSTMKAARSINRYLIFFVEIERQWSTLPAYAELVHHFTADGLRRMRIPMAWLQSAEGLAVDSKVRASSSEQRRIMTTLAAFPDGLKHTALNGYYRNLLSRVEQGTTSERSVRLALKSAREALLACGPDRDDLPSTQSMLALLRKSPGSTASLTGFVLYLNKCFNRAIDIQLMKQRARLYAQQKLERQILDLVQEAQSGVQVEERWIPLALKHFHRVSRIPPREQLRVRGADEGGLWITLNAREYWVPDPRNLPQD